MSGRTYWLKKDVGWWERGVVRRARKEFGPAGPAVMDWLECAAKRQNAGGKVKADPFVIAEDTGADEVTVCHVVSHLVLKKWLVSYETDGDLFKAKIAWFEADQTRGDAAERKAESRANRPDSESLSRSVTESHLRGEENRGEETTSLSATPTADVRAIFDAWIASTGRTSKTVLDGKRERVIRKALKSFPVDDLIDAVDGWRFSPHHRGENDQRTVYNDLGLLLRDAAQIEKFRDLKRGGGAVVALRPVDAPKPPSRFARFDEAAGL